MTGETVYALSVFNAKDCLSTQAARPLLLSKQNKANRFLTGIPASPKVSAQQQSRPSVYDRDRRELEDGQQR